MATLAPLWPSEIIGSSSPFRHYEQSRSAVRQHRATECLKHDVVKFNAVSHRPQHGDGEHELSSPETGRTTEHCSAAVKERDLCKQVASALIVDFGHYRSTHKVIAQRAGVSPETVKRWVAADSAPSLVYFLRLLPHSPSLRKLVAMESELSPDFTRELSQLIQRHLR